MAAKSPPPGHGDLPPLPSRPPAATPATVQEAAKSRAASAPVSAVGAAQAEPAPAPAARAPRATSSRASRRQPTKITQSLAAGPKDNQGDVAVSGPRTDSKASTHNQADSCDSSKAGSNTKTVMDAEAIAVASFTAEAVTLRVTELLNPMMAEFREGVREDVRSLLAGSSSLRTAADAKAASPCSPVALPLFRGGANFDSTNDGHQMVPKVQSLGDAGFVSRFGGNSEDAVYNNRQFSNGSQWSKKNVRTASVDQISSLLHGGATPKIKRFQTYERPQAERIPEGATVVNGNELAMPVVPTSSRMFPQLSQGDGDTHYGDLVTDFDDNISEGGEMSVSLLSGRSMNGALLPAEAEESEEGPKNLSEWALMVVSSKEVETLVAALVLLNAVGIGLQTEYQSIFPNANRLPDGFHTADVFFCLAFSTEMLFRLVALRLRFFTADDCAWNIFDLFVVGISVIDLFPTELLLDGVEQNAKTSVENEGGSIGGYPIFQMLRFVRIIRLARILRFIDELRTITVCILGSMRSLGWTMLLLAMMIYVVAICLTQVVVDHRRRDDEITDELIYWYGSMVRTCFTLYESITSGVSWDEAVNPLIMEISPVLGGLFAFYIAFTVFAMLNVVTGVFVENAMDSAEKDKKEMMIAKICDLFKRTDDDGSGEINWDEFNATLKTQEMQDYFKSIDVDISEAKGLFDLLDADRSGSIDAVEFVSGCVRLTGPAKAFDVGLLLFELRIFREDLLAEIEVMRAQLTVLRGIQASETNDRMSKVTNRRKRSSPPGTRRQSASSLA